MSQKHGCKQGDPIPGSRYVRGFCASCGEPMRIFHSQVKKPCFCEVCSNRDSGTDMANMTPRQRFTWQKMQEEV